MLGHYLAIPKVGEYRRTKASCNQWSLYIEKGNRRKVDEPGNYLCRSDPDLPISPNGQGLNSKLHINCQCTKCNSHSWTRLKIKNPSRTNIMKLKITSFEYSPPSDFQYDAYSDFISGILLDINSDILFGILSGIYCDVFLACVRELRVCAQAALAFVSRMYSDILSGILSGISCIFFSICFWHVFWQSCWHFIWPPFCYFIWHLFLECILTFFLTFCLAFYLASLVLFIWWHVFWLSTDSFFWHLFIYFL